jgi:hypothetical protein
VATNFYHKYRMDVKACLQGEKLKLQRPPIPAPEVYVKQSTIGPFAGNGVFASRDYKKNETVEIAPLLLDTDANWNLGDEELGSDDEEFGPRHQHYTMSYDPTYRIKYVSKSAADKESGEQVRTMEPIVEKRPARGKKWSCFMLGHGSLYNHHAKHNLMFYFGACETIVFFATRDIKKDEELFIHYGDDYWKGHPNEDEILGRTEKAEKEGPAMKKRKLASPSKGGSEE